MILVNRWLKVIGVFCLLVAILTILEVQSVVGQSGQVLILPVKPGMHNIQLPLVPGTSFRPYMPAQAQVQAVQNGGSQFGFNGITGTTNSGGNNFVGGNLGGLGGIGGIGGSQQGISGIGGLLSGGSLGNFGVGGSISGGIGGIGGIGGQLGGGLGGIGGGIGGGLGGLGGGLGGIGGGVKGLGLNGGIGQ